MTGASFDDLVAVAAIGVTRKGLAIDELAGPAAGQAGVLDRADPAAALLDAAALLTAARRAGLRPVTAADPGDAACPGTTAGPAEDEWAGPAAATAAAERELPPRATRLLRRLGQADSARGFAAADSELLAGLLTAARDAGYVLPAPLLPALLDAAGRDSGLRPAVAGMLGARGRWLVAHRADWRRATGPALAAEPLTPAPGPGVAGPGGAGVSEAELVTWRTGGRDERRGLLARLRRRDPAAGRELLAGGWARETGADRAALLAVLGQRLSAADEEFLEAALDDRAAGVRDTARLLLGQLPGSAFRRRAARRAAPVLRVERHGRRRRLAVTPPGEPDAAALRDGIAEASPVPGIGPAGWRLIQVLAAAPLGDWTRQLGLTPADLAALPVADDLGPYVHAGWRQAIARQQPAAAPDRGAPPGAGRAEEGAAELTAWALALLAAGAGRQVTWPVQAWPGDAALTAVLPAASRSERAAASLKDAVVDDRARAYTLAAEVAACPAPWGPGLSEAALGLLARAATRPDLPSLPRSVLTLAGRRLPAGGPRDYAAALTELAAARPQAWSPLLHAAAELIALRRAFLAELQPTVRLEENP